MLPQYRRLVEQLAQRGTLRVICGNATLGVVTHVRELAERLQKVGAAAYQQAGAAEAGDGGGESGDGEPGEPGEAAGGPGEPGGADEAVEGEYKEV